MIAIGKGVRAVRWITVAAVLVTALAFAPLGAPQVGAVSPDIVISQIYGGGGNSGAPLLNDFIELYNLGLTPVDITGWSVQYASATGSSWQVTPLVGSLPAGSYYLIKESSGGTNGVALPTPDASGSISMAAGAGKVALVTNLTALSCGLTQGSCAASPAATTIKDFVGYGTTANDFEGSGRAPVPSATLADLRNGSPRGATDTDVNSADFTAGAPTPTACGCGTPIRIHNIQGATHISPFKGTGIGDVPGIVTAVRSTGFYMQDPTPDADDATSEGIFVFISGTGGIPPVVGDSVTVSGTVSEFRPGGTSGANNLTTTELSSTNANVALVMHNAPLPPAIIVGVGGRVPPAVNIEDDATGDVEMTGVFDPATDALDFYESLEGMRVQINDAVAVGPRNSFGELPLLPDAASNTANRTARGGVIITPTDFNPRRVIIAGAVSPTPIMNVGDMLPGATVGVLDYDFGNFMLEVTSVPAVVPGGIAKEITGPVAADQLAIATFNVQNLDPSDGAAKFAGLANVIVTNLRSPDIIALEEIQDNNGATDNGTVDATTTANTLISAITTAGGPSYQYRDIVPVNDQDGGEPGGNIRVAFLFRTDRGVSFVDRPGGAPTAAVSVVTDSSGTHLSSSPGRIDPTNPAFTTSRKPLAGEFTYHGQRLFVIANHFNSKGGDTPLYGHTQPPTRISEVQRNQQATVVHDFVQSIVTADAQAKVVVLGDLNDFPFSTALATLKGTPAILTDLISTLPANEQYTYVFEGNSQVLDHILVTSGANLPSLQYDVVHVNAEFVDQVSDHDPQIVRLTLPFAAPAVTAIAPAVGNVIGGSHVTITGTGFRAGATVSFGGVAATEVVVVNDTTIDAQSPPHPAGVVDVVVTNTDNLTGTLTGGFTYQTDPATTPPGRTPPSGVVSPPSGRGSDTGTTQPPPLPPTSRT